MEIAAPALFGGSALRSPVADASQIGHCRRLAQRLAETQGFDSAASGRVGIVATELATNVLRHGGGGEILIQCVGAAAAAEIEVIALDKGPGMANVAYSLRDGVSTAGSPGTGLGAISRLSRLFDIYTQTGRGTAVLSRIARSMQPIRTAEPRFEWGAFARALPGEEECGDRWKIAFHGDTVAILMADGLGHGLLAAHASDAAAAIFAATPFQSPVESLRKMHAALTGGRGAAAACALLHLNTAKISYAGVGNISGTVAGVAASRGMVSHNGTVGVQLLKVQQFDYDLPEGARLIMHSDGVSARWRLADYPGLMQRHCSLMGAVLYRDHGRPRDDASIAVIGIRP